MSAIELGPVWLSLRLAAVTTLCLFAVGLPLALWLAFGRSRLRVVVEAVTALPLVLPPTVLGFYLLVLLGPRGVVGRFWEGLGGDRLVFSFTGLVLGSMLYSLPFVVQPLTNAFRSVDDRLLEVAATLGASRFDRLKSIILPLSRGGMLTAATLGFAHTMGEFGVVLMVGGNIEGRTQVLSIAIYDHVETGRYASAHWESAFMLAFSLVVLLGIYSLSRRFEVLGR